MQDGSQSQAGRAGVEVNGFLQARSAPAMPAGQTPQPPTLPAQPTAFVGRADELAEILSAARWT